MTAGAHGAEGTEALTGDAAELATLRALCDVAFHFADTWAELMQALPDDYDCHMNCAEANAAADLYGALGYEGTAKAILAEHARHDDEGDEHWEPKP